MKVRIPKRHLKDADYFDNDNCPLAKTLKDLFPKRRIHVDGFYVGVDGKEYDIVEGRFDIQDAIKAQKPVTVTIKGLRAPRKKGARRAPVSS